MNYLVPLALPAKPPGLARGTALAWSRVEAFSSTRNVNPPLLPLLEAMRWDRSVNFPLAWVRVRAVTSQLCNFGLMTSPS